MKLYKIVNEEKIAITPDVNIFESVNTHSGDEQEVLLSIAKDDSKTIKNLMCEFAIIDNEETYKLKRNATDDDSVFYYRTITGKIMSFQLFLKKDKDFVPLKPDKDGVFYIEKNWNINEEIVLKLKLICEEYYSEKFGENKVILFEVNFIGDEHENEAKTFV